MPLTTDERTALETAFMRGPSALLEQGWNGDQIEQFFGRPDVKLEAEALIQEFRDGESYASRLKFGLKRQLGRYASGATAILGAALAGPIYARDKSGHIINDVKGRPVLVETGPTDKQLTAASAILDRVGVAPEGRGAVQVADRNTVNINLRLVQAEALKVEITDDPTYTTKEERALSRERCRNAIEMLSTRLGAIRARAVKALPSGKKKKGKKKAGAVT